MKKLSWHWGLALVLFLGSLTGVQAQTLSLAITDLEGLEKLQTEFGPFKAKLEELSGLSFKFYPVGSRTAAVEALKSKKVDLVLTGPAEYVIFKTLANPKIVASFSRPDYYCIISVLADSPYASLAQLKGKKVALGDVGSTSKHLAPLQMFKDGGLEPLKDLDKVHTSVKLGWEALKKGDVAAFATTSDKFFSLRDGEKDLVPGSFRVLARGGDLPNDILLAGPHVDDKVVAKIRETLLKNSAALVAEVVKGDDNKKYKGMKFLGTVEDQDYNLIRSMYLTAGYPQFSKFIE